MTHDSATVHDTPAVGSRTNREADAGTVLQWAIAAGIGTGLIESLWLSYRRHGMGRLIYQGSHYFWLSPLTNLVIFLLIGGVLASAVRFVPRPRRPRLVAWLFLFVAMMGLRGLAPRVHVAAWLMLSAGVATTLSKPLALASPAAQMRLRRVAIGGLLLTVMLTLMGLGTEWRSERSAIARLPASSPDAPNVLLIVLDTVPAKRMSLYGYAQPTTPQIESFAKTGVVFDRCISPSPWTLPSHGSMFTGVMPQEQSSGWTEPFDDRHPTIAERLRERGYATAGFGANTYYLSAEFGLNRGFGRFREPRTLLMQAIRSSQLADSIANRTILPVFQGRVVGQKSAEDINRECLNWIDGLPADRPYFAFLNYIDTHGPYAPPREFAERYGLPEGHSAIPSLELLSDPDAPEKLRQVKATYEACLTYVDDQVGALLDALEQRDQLDDTLVIITADHGEQLGENQVMGHGNSLYLPQIHVPLVISFPGRVPHGRHVESVVSLLDLPTTIVDLLGLPNSVTFPGTSMVPLLSDTTAPANPARVVAAQVSPKPKERTDRFEIHMPLAKGEMRSALTDQYHYILNGDGSEELYRYLDDPDETQNLIDQVEITGQLEPLRAAVRD
jgi:arylsulfatase A-like enzyme